MPSDMTMERPHPRIISQEINHHITRFPRTRIPPVEELCVPSLGVIGTRDNSVPFPHSFSDDPEGMAVEVHWVREGDSAAQDDADRGAITKVENVRLRGVRGVALVCEEE